MVLGSMESTTALPAAEAACVQATFPQVECVVTPMAAPKSVGPCRQSLKATPAVSDRVLWLLAMAMATLALALVCLVVTLSTAMSTAGERTAKRTSSPVGWLGACGAIVAFGSTNLLRKLSSLQDADAAARPGLFAMFTCLGIGLTNVLLCWALRLCGLLDGGFALGDLVWGLTGALDISAIQFAAFRAVDLLGVAVAPALRCGIGMTTSFCWGLVAFEEPVQSVTGAAVALVALAAGVAVCASSRTELPQKAAALIQRCWQPEHTKARSQATADIEQCANGGDGKEERGRDPREASKSSPVVTAALIPPEVVAGISLTVLIGIMDGSLMVPYKMHLLQFGGDAAGGSPEDLSFEYLQVFGISLLLLSPLLLLFQGALWQRQQKPFAVFRASARTCALPGLTVGYFWAAGNACSVHATAYLGIALGFPLTQTCIVVNALWGLILFNEMPNCPRRLACAAGICTILTGAVLLAFYGST